MHQSHDYLNFDRYRKDADPKVEENDDYDDEESDGHTFFESNCTPILPSIICCCDHEARDKTFRHLVFSSPVSYHWWNAILLGMVPLSTILSMAVIYNDPRVTHSAKTRDILLLCFASCFILLIFFLLLPRRIDLYNNGTVALVTYFYSHEFGDVVSASDDPTSVRETWRQPRIKCTTNFVRRILLRRKKDNWDIVVSPTDAKGLLTAVKEISDPQSPTRMQDQVYTV